MTLEELIQVCIGSGTVSHFKGFTIGTNAGGGQEYTAYLPSEQIEQNQELGDLLNKLQEGNDDGVSIAYGGVRRGEHTIKITFRKRRVMGGGVPMDYGPVLRGYKLMEEALKSQEVCHA